MGAPHQSPFSSRIILSRDAHLTHRPPGRSHDTQPACALPFKLAAARQVHRGVPSFLNFFFFSGGTRMKETRPRREARPAPSSISLLHSLPFDFLSSPATRRRRVPFVPVNWRLDLSYFSRERSISPLRRYYRCIFSAPIIYYRYFRIL